MRKKNIKLVNQNSEPAAELISRRSMLKSSIFPGLGILLATQTGFPAILIKRQPVDLKLNSGLMNGKKISFDWLFNIRSHFWRGFGAVVLALGKRALGLDGINFGGSSTGYGQSQPPPGWYQPPGTDVYQIPQFGTSFGYVNNQQTNFRDLKSTGDSTVGMNPATIIALKYLAEGMRCGCKNLTNSDIANWVIPRSLLASTPDPTYLNGEYDGNFSTNNGTIRVIQTPKYPTDYKMLSDLRIEVKSPWKSTDIFKEIIPPLQVSYS